ncbi:MBOAT, membrane-bound O-acyltransferase family-domain-containing protein [Cladochytrium replicatum]|nr:MBOAT, membrane-bound O-acyltransferase family-domain-containing protein [Cladochytrium replicatum]
MSDSILVPLSRATGISVDNLAALIPLFGCYPFAYFSSYFVRPLARPWAQHVFSVAVSSILCLSVFRISTLVQIFGISVTSWILLIPAGLKSSAGGVWTHFAIVMCWLVSNHFYYQVITTEKSRFDDTIPMMIVCIKLTSFAWSLHDGTKASEDLIEELRDCAVRVNPDLLEYLGYVYFFSSFMVGPAFNFQDYYKFVRAQPPFTDIPSRTRSVMRVTGIGLICMISYVLLAPMVSYDAYLRHGMKNLPFILRNVMVVVACFTARLKYYLSWKLSEASCIMTGIAYNGKRKQDPNEKVDTRPAFVQYLSDKADEHDWNRVRGCDIRGIEYAQNIKVLLDNWNMGTQRWLRSSVYLRLVDKDGKSNAAKTTLTFILSALWHGIRPGYYIFFGSLSLLVMVGRLTRRGVRPLFAAPPTEKSGTVPPLASYKFLYDAVGWMVTQLCVAHFGGAFETQNIYEFVEIELATGGWLIYVALLGTYAFLQSKFWLKARDRILRK